ncbi:MAG TPA: hypothetical protein VF457_13075 [Burkholderiaceae bacterium]
MNHDTNTALARIFWSWLLVGISQMTPLQAVQFLAAAAATIYTVLQTGALVAGWVRHWRGRP